MNHLKFALRQWLTPPGFPAAALLTLALGIGANSFTHGAEHSADSDWTAASPEEVGMDSGALVEMLDAVRQREIPVHSIQMVRHGRIALDAYFYPFQAGMRHDIASVTKSVTST